MGTSRQDKLEQICRAFGVVILYVFGSRSIEVYTWLRSQQESLPPGPSDVDIGTLIPFNLPWTIHDTVRLTLALEELLGVYRVDLVLLNRTDPFLAANIIRGERLFARDSYEADEYELFVLRRAGDLIPLERERMDLILRATL